MGCVNHLGCINSSVVTVLRHRWMWSCLTAALHSTGFYISNWAAAKAGSKFVEGGSGSDSWNLARVSSWLFHLNTFAVNIHLQREEPFWDPYGTFCGRSLLLENTVQGKCLLHLPLSTVNKYFPVNEELRCHQPFLWSWIKSSSFEIDA